MTLTEDEEVTVDPRQASRIKELDQYAQGVSVYYQNLVFILSQNFDPPLVRYLNVIISRHLTVQILLKIFDKLKMGGRDHH